MENKRKREEEAKKKAEERARKAAERQQRKLEQEESRKRKAEEKKRKADLRRTRPQRSTTSGVRGPITASSVGESNTTPGADGESSTDVPSETGAPNDRDSAPPGCSDEHTTREESDQSECSVCLGRYEDDIIDGVLQKEWVQCTNTSRCGLWMHSDCLSTEGNSYVCYMCNVTFK